MNTTPPPAQLSRLAGRIDDVLGWYAAAAAGLLAVVLISEAFTHGWSQTWFVVVVYIVIAYLVLPRVHTVLSAVYLPDYFIGRTRTREGILGDPVNIAVLGSGDQIHSAMLAAGWVLADDLGGRANVRMVIATLTGRSYISAPVSNLYLFGRRHAFCYQQEVDGSPGKRHHIRFWPTPDGWLLPGGRRVDWLAAGTFDRSVGINVFTWQVTHRIADDIDTERDYVVASLTTSTPAAQVEVLENFSTGYHSRNGGGDAIVTDGNLPVVNLQAVPLRTHEVAPEVRDGSPRPADILLGAALIALRPVAAAVLLMALVTGRSVSGTALPHDPVTIAVVAVFFALFAALWWGLAYGIVRGKRGARVMALTLSGVAVATIGVSWFHGHDHLTMRNGLAGFALDVAILFALSSSEARRWSIGPKRRRLYRHPRVVAAVEEHVQA